MATLHTKVKLYLEANGKTYASERRNLMIQNNSDGAGDFIASWDVSGLAQPTAEQLASYDSSGDTAEANQTVVNTREGLYGTTAEQFEYLVENGVDAFIAKQNQIKSDNPKS